MEKIGFIGLGNMGMPMAQNLISNGIKVKGFDVSEEVLKQASKNTSIVHNHLLCHGHPRLSEFWASQMMSFFVNL